jgi:drug/metabolite transporter (DMT)-like permease
LNIVILLVLTILFMNKKMDKKHILGVLIIFGGLYLLR